MVSIPFTSGLLLNWRRCTKISGNMRLNPFYFRAAAEQEEGEENGFMVVSIPFTSGLLLNPHGRRQRVAGQRLNPFYFRAAAEHEYLEECSSWMSLNPFYFRAAAELILCERFLIDRTSQSLLLQGCC